jgi:hypothetical protein
MSTKNITRDHIEAIKSEIAFDEEMLSIIEGKLVQSGIHFQEEDILSKIKSRIDTKIASISLRRVSGD